MNPDDFDLLAACFEARRRQHEMVPHIAAALRVPNERVFSTWMFDRQNCDADAVPETPWRFFFHGLECDLQNTADGRFVRYDFGPGGRFDCVTAWGVLQFVMASKAPWREFPALRERLARTGPPYDCLAGNHSKVSAAWDRLERAGCFEPADRNLVAFRERHTTIRPDGIRFVSYPEGTSEETMIDCMVAHRPLLTDRARALAEKAARRNT